MRLSPQGWPLFSCPCRRDVARRAALPALPGKTLAGDSKALHGRTSRKHRKTKKPPEGGDVCVLTQDIVWDGLTIQDPGAMAQAIKLPLL